MYVRITATTAAALAVVSLSAACSPRQTSASQNTALVSVNGTDTQLSIVNCKQLDFTRTIHIGGDFARAVVVVDQSREPLVVDSVQIQNLGGFTGRYSLDDGDHVDASFSGGKFTITGTANGFKVVKPTEPASSPFKIIATC